MASPKPAPAASQGRKKSPPSSPASAAHKAFLTAAALRDPDDIRSYTTTHFPTALAALDRRLQASLRRIGAWPERAPPSPAALMVTLVRDLSRMIHRIAPARAELPHIHPTARLAP